MDSGGCERRRPDHGVWVRMLHFFLLSALFRSNTDVSVSCCVRSHPAFAAQQSLNSHTFLFVGPAWTLVLHGLEWVPLEPVITPL